MPPGTVRTDSASKDLIGLIGDLAADQFVGQALILGGEIEKIPLPFRGGFFPRGFSHQFRQMPVVLRACKFVFHRRPVRQLSYPLGNKSELIFKVPPYRLAAQAYSKAASGVQPLLIVNAHN
jgi:hypothetical protein